MALYKRGITQMKSDMIKLTPSIEIPKPVGQNQYGSARFTTPEEQKEYFDEIDIEDDNEVIQWLINEGMADYKAVKSGEVRDNNNLKLTHNVFEKGGIPVAWNVLTDKEKSNKIEKIKMITGDVHTVTFGATRCGKTRTLVIQSIVLQALAGLDMLNSDPKGELYQYTYPFLIRLGYKVFAIDFTNPSKSIRYNFLQLIIDSINENTRTGKSKAISYAWDFVNCLVREGKNDNPLWANGEKGLVAAAILFIVYENSPFGLKKQYPDATDKEIQELYETKHRHYQNCTNLFHFISKMAVENPKTKHLLLEDIITVLPDDHPSKMLMAIPQSAPSKTRGSFITSALATLSLFTDPNIAYMTSDTDKDIFNPAIKKAIFMILPDSKKTYYPTASLFIDQYYQYLATEVADKKGGRLDRDFEFNLDEFGNFTSIPFFDGKMTVAAGRGIHFHLYVQSKEQLTEKYNKEIAGIILDNCHYWIYLRTSGQETLNLIETSLGKYTVMSTSSSASKNDNGSLSINTSGSTSTSSQLMGRPLLTAEEIKRIERPYLLTMTTGFPSLTQIPDLHKWSFNKILGLGSQAHNKDLRIYRENLRPVNEIGDISLWDFLPYINELVKLKEEGQNDNAMLSAINENINDSF